MGESIVVIPAFNEARTIGEVVSSIRPYCKVLVVDDCSSDDTSGIAASAGALVMRTETNRGYDGALNLGIAEAARIAEFILLMDADGQHVSSDIPQLLEVLSEGRADVVVGVRPKVARVSEKLYSIYSRLKLGIHDPLCGFKAFKAEVYRKVGYFDSLSSIGTEFIFAAHSRGYKLAEIPILIRPRLDVPRFGEGLRIRAEIKILRALAKVMMRYR